MWHRILRVLLLATFAVPGVFASPSDQAIRLPIEVLGVGGTVVSQTFTLDAGQSSAAVALWLRVHGLRYAEEGSLQWNDGLWVPLNNSAVTILGPAKNFGGIGGAFSTIEMRLLLPRDSARSGSNTIRFRFNRSDGLASGFRVLDFNLLSSGGGKLLPPERILLDSPDSWTAPHPDSASIEAGRQLWHSATLVENDLPGSPRIQARCADCHALDGRDLKYFNFSNLSIVVRSRFHGLTALQGERIASYIRSLPVPSPGRPWNPPYQPGPALDQKPVAHWAAGAGVDWVLQSDSDSLSYLAAQSREARLLSEANLVPSITPDVFRPDGNLNAREIPIALPLPDWNQWLPRIHPKDAWGAAFTQSKFAALLDGADRSSLRGVLASLQKSNSSYRAALPLFSQWSQARRSFLARRTKSNTPWSAERTNKVYSTQLWQLVKTWELMQEFTLEDRGQDAFDSSGDSRTWWTSTPGDTAPVATHIPNGPFGVNGSALNNEYLNAAWYELQIVLNSGTHRRHDRQPVDWVYFVSEFRLLFELTHEPEPARLLVAVTKALQSSDPRANPSDYSEGWRPEQNVDPRVLVAPQWALMYQPLPSAVRRAVTQSLLQAWLEKNLQYTLPQYLSLPAPPRGSSPLYGDENISGGKAWLAIDLFRAAGVSPDLLDRLQKWGEAYTDRAARIQY